MEEDITKRDTIPRVNDITYFEELLIGIFHHENFDQLRRRIQEVKARTKRASAPRVSDGYTMWAPTADALEEFMRLGLVESCPLPSRRQYVDSHREAIYILTPDGQEMASLIAENQRADFRVTFTERLVDKHLYFRNLLVAANDNPILVPEYTEQDLLTFRSEPGRWHESLAKNVAGKLSQVQPIGQVNSSADEIAAEVIRYVTRRFGDVQPTRKDLLDAVHDAISSIALLSRELRVDAISLNTLVSLGKQLYVLNESRYVLGWPGRTIWATATLTPNGTIVRRGVKDFGDQVEKALVGSYAQVIDVHSEKGIVKFPYVPIYLVRAQAAFQIRVNNPVVDRVLAEMVKDQRDAGVLVAVALGQGVKPPPSESVFLLDGKEYFLISMQLKEGEVRIS